MLEWVMRINDYFFNQLLASLSDSNPYLPLIDKVTKEFALENEHALSP